MFEAHLIQGVESLAEAELLDFPEERDDVAVLETAEAVERVRLRVDGKRRVAVIVERAYDHSNYGSLPSLIRRFAWVR